MNPGIPSVLDVREISAKMVELHRLSITGAMAAFPLMATLETLRQNIKAMDGKSDYGGFLVKLCLLVAALSAYKLIFDTTVGAFFIMENSLVGMDQWAKLLNELAYFRDQGLGISWFRSTLPVFFAWTGSFSAIIFAQILFWIQYAVLALLYFLGPFALSLAIFEPARYLIGAWFKNLISVCMWSFVLKLIVVVMLQVQILLMPTTGSLLANSSTVVAVSVCFIVMVVFSPYLAEKMVSGQAVGSVVVIASSYFTGKTLKVGNLLDRHSWGPAANQASNVASKIGRMVRPSDASPKTGADRQGPRANASPRVVPGRPPQAPAKG